jgi:hypothetical protein
VVAACTSPFWSSEAVAQIVLDPTVPAVMHPQRLYEKPKLPVVTGNPTDVYPNKSAKALEILKKKHLIDLGPFSSHAVHRVEYLPECATGRPSLEAFLRRGNILTPALAVELPLPTSHQQSVDSSSAGRQETRYRPASSSANRRDQSESQGGRQVSWSPSVPPPAPQGYSDGYSSAAVPSQGGNSQLSRGAPARGYQPSPSMPSAWYDVA